MDGRARPGRGWFKHPWVHAALPVVAALASVAAVAIAAGPQSMRRVGPVSSGELAVLLVAFACIVLAGSAIDDLRTARAAAAGARRAQSRVDDVTGLLNRYGLEDRLIAIARSGSASTIGPGAHVAILCCDIDGFGRVNLTSGYGVGDGVLRAVAGRLKGALRADAPVARVGADDFVVVLEGVDRRSAAAAAERLVATLIRPIGVDGLPLHVRLSVGVAHGTRHGVADGSLLTEAGEAVVRAKAAGGNRAMGGQADGGSGVTPAIGLGHQARSRLLGALGRDEFNLVYQPVTSIATGEVVAAEALLRWSDSREPVGPDRFVPALESSGHIVEVGDWVLEQACREAVTWQAAGRRIRVAVNVSPRQLAEPDYSARAARIIERSGLDPAAVALEVTEAVLVDDMAAAWRQLRDLKRLGVSISLDDFGTGYASIAYLRSIAIDILKIDQSLVRPLPLSVEDGAIVKAIVGMALALGITPVAEGVERLDQAELLVGLGCDLAQGYFYSRPLAPEAFAAYLGSSPMGRSAAGPAHGDDASGGAERFEDRAGHAGTVEAEPGEDLCRLGLGDELVGCAEHEHRR